MGRPTPYAVNDVGFLIGSVPGCDLRVPGANLPPVLCLVTRHPGGATVKRLAPTYPVLVNGQPVSSSPLADGDHVTIGSVDLVVQVGPVEGFPVAAAAPQAAQLEAAKRQLQQQLQAFREQVVQFDREKSLWEQQRQRLEHAHGPRGPHAEAAAAQPEREREVARLAAAVERDREALAQRQAEVESQRREVATLRQELADIRKELYDRYQERRDRLAGLQEAVNKAARKVQERKQHTDAEALQVSLKQQEAARRESELEDRAAAVAQAQQRLTEERRLLDDRHRQLQEDMARRLAECQSREQQLAAGRKELEQSQAQHRDDLLRLDRFKGELAEREKQLEERAAATAAGEESLQGRCRKLEEQVVQLDEWHTRLCAMAEQLARQKQQQDQEAAALAQRSAGLEGQQSMLAGLRARLEQMREEARKAEQQLAEDRARQQEQEQLLQAQQAEAQQLLASLDGEKAAADEERRQLAERGKVLEAAVAQLRQAQAKLAEAEQRLHQETEELHARTAAHADREKDVEARGAQVRDAQQRLEADRQALTERLQLLAQAEQARETLQEQLRRRSEELAARQKALEEAAGVHQADAEAVRLQKEDVHKQRAELAERVQQHTAEIEARAEQLARQKDEQDERERRLAAAKEKVQEVGRQVAGRRKELQEERERLEELRRQTDEAARQARDEYETNRRDAAELLQRLPDLELRAGTAFERLSSAREQLREHVNEVHAYAGQCQEHLDGLRAGVHAEGERLQIREHALRRQQDEQRLALATFRQQLIDWQGQIAEIKRLLTEKESRLELRQAQVIQQVRQVDEVSTRLARQAEELEQQQREVDTQREVINNHLTDMQQWYRRKLRELSGVDEGGDAPARPAALGKPAEADTAVPGRDILSLTGEVDPGDRRLGDLLQSLGLIEADALSALLQEARRQRRPLRQVLLAGGTVTLYQVALIEAGNLDGLMLGPVRVVDRLHVTPHETLYRVFDPVRGREAVLRHLAEEEMEDAVHPDEFRQRFRQAMVFHPNVQATLDVYDIAGRPAALQEWTTGLAAPEWPMFAGVPGVWFRLVQQAALALHTVHQTGLVHGHLQVGDFLLTTDGVLKLCGLGEPPWLLTPPATDVREDASGDLHDFGKLAAGWGEVRDGRRSKAFPAGLKAILDRLTAKSADDRYPDAAALLQELDAVAAEVPANPEAWERLLRHVREHAVGGPVLRQSA